MSRIWKHRISIYLYFVLLIIAVLSGVSILSALLSWLLPLPGVLPEAVYTIIFIELMGCTATVLLFRKILAPITRLSRAMNQMAQGDFKVALDTRSQVKEIQELYKNFNLMARELAATETLQSDFVSNVSHEFKTPINAIEGYTMLLQGDDSLSDEQAEYTEKILFNTKRLSGLVSNILLLSKIDNQSLPAKQEFFRLDEQIRQAIVYLEPKWSKKDIEFDADLKELSFMGNENLLLHVWLNLIDNAIKFDSPGGSISIRLQSSEQNILVSVQDTGPGIAEEERKRIFHKFYQADSSHKDEGNGLGLALVNQIVTLHHGTIDVENCEAGGCKFTVVLPIQA